jgi:hypothetical protein
MMTMTCSCLARIYASLERPALLDDFAVILTVAGRLERLFELAFWPGVNF